MTLENAVKHIMKDTFSWMKMMSDNETKMLINFPSIFLHNCTLLKQTEEFKLWSKLSFLKPKILHFNFDNDTSFNIEFWNPKDDHGIREVNKLIKLEIDRYLRDIEMVKLEKWNKPITVNFSKDIKVTVEENKELLNLQTIENFNF